MFSKLISKIDNIIDRFLSGQENLWKAFWGMFILSIVMTAITLLLPIIIDLKLFSLLSISKDYLLAADEKILSPTSKIFKIILFIPTISIIVF